MNAVRIPVTPMMVAHLLRLPPGADVIGAQMSDEGYVVFIVEHPDLPAAEHGAPLTIAIPHYRRLETETEPRVEFIEWGIQT